MNPTPLVSPFLTSPDGTPGRRYEPHQFCSPGKLFISLWQFWGCQFGTLRQILRHRALTLRTVEKRFEPEIEKYRDLVFEFSHKEGEGVFLLYIDKQVGKADVIMGSNSQSLPVFCLRLLLLSAASSRCFLFWSQLKWSWLVLEPSAILRPTAKLSVGGWQARWARYQNWNLSD